MAIDWEAPVMFQNGDDGYVIAKISAFGKCSFRDGTPSEHADLYADLYERGVRYMVATDPTARTGGCVNAMGIPIEPFEEGYSAAPFQVFNRPSPPLIDTSSMEMIHNWGLFG